MQQLRQAAAEQIVEEKKEEVKGMKKWMAAVGLVLLLLVGVMPANIRQAEAKNSGIPANMVFDTVSIENETIEKGKSITFSVSNPKADLDFEIRGYKWTVKNGLTDFSSDEELFTGINTNTLTIKDVDKNCILDGATVSLTLIVDVNGEPSELPITNTAKLSASHTPGEDWIIDEEASSGAIQVSNKTCTACGTVVGTKEEVAPLENPVYVGGQALQNAGDFVIGNSGTATLYIAQDGSPVLVLDNYVYTGAGCENTEDNYVGIYYGGSDTLYIFCGPNEDSRAVSQNTITVTAEGVKCSRGIYVPNGTLYIGTTDNGTEDTLTVTAGTATIYSDGICANEIRVQDATIDLYTSTDVNSTGQYALTSNCVINAIGGNTTGDGASTSTGISCTTLNVSGGTVNATGGTAEGYSTPTSHGINCSGDATFSGGKITATGGKASYEIDSNNTVLLHEAKTHGIYADTMTISGAEVTATGETCGGHVPGAARNLRYSYGCYGNITMTAGSLIAIGGNLLMEDTTTGGRYSYGIYGGITATSGIIEAIGGNTVGGESYGIYLNKDSSFSGEAIVTATTKTESTDDYRYAIYAKEPQSVVAMELTVADSASVTATVAEGARLNASGIYADSSYITFIQTGGTVVASTPKANQAGAHFMKADISGGTFNATAKTMAFYAYELHLTGGDITGTANSTLGDTLAVDSTGIQIGTLTMTAGSITGQGGESSTSASYGVRIVTSANVSGGTITGTGGRVSSGNLDVMSYGIEAPGLNLSGGTVIGTGGQASGSSFGVYVTSSATLSEEAVLVGNGGVSDRGNSTGIFGKNFSVADSASVTGTGGQASNGNSTGISLSEDFVMSADSSAQVTGTGGSGNSSRGIYLSCNYSLDGGTLTAKGGASYTTESIGIYLYYYDFLMGGTLVTATGYTNAVGGNDKFVHSEAMAASANIDGSNREELQYGSYLVSSLAGYKYLEAGTTEQLGFTPGERDISDAEIKLGPTLTYNGEAQTMTVISVMLGGVDLLANSFVEVTDNTVTDAGTHTLTVTATEESYYTGSATKEFTVNRLTITPIVTVKEASYPYDSTIDPSDVIVKHGETELVYNKDYTIYSTWTRSVGENQGYVMVQSVATGSNFYWNGTATGTFTVVKAENPVEVTTPITVIRGGNWVNLAYSNNQAGNPSYSFVGDALGCIIENGTVTSGDTEGTVTVQATFPSSDQYNEAVRTITVTITDKNRAELANVNIADTDYQYDDATKLAQVYHSGSGSRVKEDIIEYSGTTRSGAAYARSTTAPTQAGNYTVYVTYETKDTIYTGSDDFEIRPKNISNLITVTLGDALTYNGTEQTQTVTEVYDANADYTFNETEYDITGNKQTDASIYYSLDINGKGNFTGSKTVSYTIAKATPTLGDFEIPAYDDTVDYTGEYIEITPPTSTKNGIGGTYIETSVRDAGTYNVTFKVYEGDNYTAATGLVYGTLTVNQVDRPTTTTNAEVILGGNAIDLDDFVSTEGSPAKTYEIVGENHGCSISNSSFTSGSEVCFVTVQVTLEGNKNYKDTVKTFTVTVTDKKTAPLTVTQDDVEYNYGEDIRNLSPDFDGEADTLVSQSMVYAGTLWNGSSYASSETKPTKAGTYTVTVTYESKDTIYTGSTTFNINPKKIGGTITLGPALTYTGASQTQTIANVQTGDYTYTEADYDVSGNVQTDAGTYTLTLEGKGNFTGTTSKSYTIAKATPQRSDFNIPALTAVDYTGEEIPVALPTSIREGMGEVYLTGGNGIINAGNHKITFGVHSGKNYTAASGFEYGTLTVNKVDHPMEVTNAIVGIGLKQIDLTTRVTMEFGYALSFEFVTPEEERLDCQINGATFTSGNKPGTVTVRATVQEGTNYLVTSKEFTVTVVEEGGVKVWGYVTSSGDSNDETTIQLLQGGETKYEMTKVGNSPNYTFDGVAAGTYTLRVSKANHITAETEVIVASEDVHVETVELKLKEFAFIAANVIMGNNLDMMFAIQSLTTADWSDYYVRIERTYANGNSNDIRIIPYSQWGTSGSYRTVTYTGLAAKEMCDVITLTVCDGEGNAVSEPWIDSMQDYATRIINKESSIALQKSMLVDMLNYGSVAQQRFGYGTDNLANSLLTVEQKGYASGEQEVSKKLTQGDKWAASNLIMESNIRLLVAIRGLTADMTATVEFTNHYGKNISIDVPGSKFGTSGTMKYIEVNQLVIADARQPITITVYNADETVYTVCQDSIEDYLARKDSGDALVAAVMKFAYSAYAYLHR